MNTDGGIHDSSYVRSEYFVIFDKCLTIAQ